MTPEETRRAHKLQNVLLGVIVLALAISWGCAPDAELQVRGLHVGLDGTVVGDATCAWPDGFERHSRVARQSKGVQMMPFTIDRVAEVRKALRDLSRLRVMVGIPSDTEPKFPADAGSQERRPYPTEKKPEIGNALIGYISERGSPARNIPARPWLDPGVQNAMPEIQRRLQDASTAAFEGHPDRMMKNLHAAGLVAVNAVRAKITEGPFVPLKPATLAARRRRGFAGERPLIESGQFRTATGYVLRKIR